MIKRVSYDLLSDQSIVRKSSEQTHNHFFFLEGLNFYFFLFFFLFNYI